MYDESVAAGDGTLPSKPLLSVLCLTYNHERFLAQALESMLMQRTNFQFEGGVGEDFSNDATAKVLERYAAHYPDKIKPLWTTVNLGMVENMRRTQALCRGRYIAICEGDDYWVDPYKLQKQVDFLEENAEYVLCFHDAVTLREGKLDHRPQLGRRFRREASARELTAGRPISTLTVCYRNVLKDIPIQFDRVPMLDICLWSLLGQYGKGAYLSDITPAVYRAHQGGAVSSQSEGRRFRMAMATSSILSNYWDTQGKREAAKLTAFSSVFYGVCQLQFSDLTKIAAFALAMPIVRNVLRVFRGRRI